MQRRAFLKWAGAVPAALYIPRCAAVEAVLVETPATQELIATAPCTDIWGLQMEIGNAVYGEGVTMAHFPDGWSRFALTCPYRDKYATASVFARGPEAYLGWSEDGTKSLVVQLLEDVLQNRYVRELWEPSFVTAPETPPDGASPGGGAGT